MLWFLQLPDIVHYPSVPGNAAPAEAAFQFSFRSTPEFIQGIHNVALSGVRGQEGCRGHKAGTGSDLNPSQQDLYIMLACVT